MAIDRLNLEGHSGSYSPRPIGKHSLPNWALVAFILLLVIVMLSFAALLPHSRRITVSGIILPSTGFNEVVAPRSGVLTSVFVDEQQEVRPGTPIAILDVDSVGLSGRNRGDLLAEAESTRTHAAALRASAEVVSIRTSFEELSRLSDAATAKITLTEALFNHASEQLRLAEDRVSRARPLLERGVISRIQFQQWEDNVIDRRIRRGSIQQQLFDSRAELAALSFERSKLENRAVLADAAAAELQASIDEARASAADQQPLTLVASQGGKVAALRAQIGTRVDAGTVVAVVVQSDAKLEASLQVPSSAVGFIEDGSPVRLKYTAYPYEHFGMGRGQLCCISTAPIAGPPGQPAQYLARVSLEHQYIEIEGRQWPILPGMEALVSLDLERRSVLSWLVGALLG